MDLTTLTPEQLAYLKQQLDALTTTRSPFRPRQLHDLRLLPTKDDPRPTFFWSAEPPRDATDLTKTTPYPRLLWHKVTGEEITVHSAMEQASKIDYITVAPASLPPPDPMDALRAQWESISLEDRALILESQQRARRKALEDQLSKLSEDQLATLIHTAEENDTAGEPAKRGPGRPRKDAVA